MNGKNHHITIMYVLIIIMSIIVWYSGCSKANADGPPIENESQIERETAIAHPENRVQSSVQVQRPNSNVPYIGPYQGVLDEREERSNNGIRSENNIPEENNYIGSLNDETIPLNSSPADLLNMGIEYLNSGYYREAISYFIKIQVQYANSAEALLAVLEHGRALTERAKTFKIREDLLLAREKLMQIITNYQEFPATFSDDFIRFIISYCETSILLEYADNEIKSHLENLLLVVDGETNQILNAYLGFLEYYKENYNTALEYFHRSNNDLAIYGMILTYGASDDLARVQNLCRDFFRYHRDSEYIESVKKYCMSSFSCLPCYQEDCQSVSSGGYAACDSQHSSANSNHSTTVPQENLNSSSGSVQGNANLNGSYRLIASSYAYNNSPGYLDFSGANEFKSRINSVHPGINFIVTRDPQDGKYVVVSSRLYPYNEALWATNQLRSHNFSVNMIPAEPTENSSH